jgi:septal ring factor EnvC (AmiA/AmiB activator)
MVSENMTQYHYEQPSTAATDPVDAQSVKDSNVLEKNIKSLSDRVQQQDDELRELQRTVKKLRNEVRVAVNSFNLKNRG